LVELAGMPLKALEDEADRKAFLEGLRTAALAEPVEYLSKVVLPVLRVLPQQVMVDIFEHHAPDEGDPEEIRELSDMIRQAYGIDGGKRLEEIDEEMRRAVIDAEAEVDNPE